jgi:hypothetical protein
MEKWPVRGPRAVAAMAAFLEFHDSIPAFSNQILWLVEAATRRLADAAEKANEIQLSSLPSPEVLWGDAVWRAGDTYSIKNVGTSAAYVWSIESEPLEHANLLTLRTDLPRIVNPGDSIEFMTIATFQGRANPVVVWSLNEHDQDFRRTFRSAIKSR